MNIVDYLKSVTGYPVSANNILAILLGRGIAATSNAEALTIEERELLQADVLMFVASLPSQISGSKQKTGDFEITEGGYRREGNSDLVKQAMFIYRKYSDERYDSSALGIIRWIDDEETI